MAAPQFKAAIGTFSEQLAGVEPELSSGLFLALTRDHARTPT